MNRIFTKFETRDIKTTAVAAMLACALQITGIGFAEAETTIVPLDRSDVVHKHTDSYSTYPFLQENDALQVIAFGYDGGFGDANLEVTRAYIEFTIPSISGTTKSTLVMQKYSDAGYHLPNVPFEVSVYDPETDITVHTFDIPTTLVTEFSTDYTVQSETVAIDVSSAVWQYSGRAMGLRIRVSDEGTLGDNITRGAGFEDSFNGVPPRIEIVDITPTEAIEELAIIIGNLVDDENLSSSLANSLGGATEIASNDNPKDDKAAANMLKAFVNKVEAMRGKQISGDAADALISGAITLQVGLQQ